MYSMALNRASRWRTAFILMLAASVLVFAVWLKVVPNLTSSPGSGITPTVRIWTAAIQESDTHVKILLIKGIFFLFALAPALLLGLGESARVILAVRPVAKDVFAESGHWFRPPPLF